MSHAAVPADRIGFSDMKRGGPGEANGPFQSQYRPQIAYSSFVPRNVKSTSTISWKPSFSFGSLNLEAKPLNAILGSIDLDSGFSYTGCQHAKGKAIRCIDIRFCSTTSRHHYVHTDALVSGTRHTESGPRSCVPVRSIAPGYRDRDWYCLGRSAGVCVCVSIYRSGSLPIATDSPLRRDSLAALKHLSLLGGCE